MTSAKLGYASYVRLDEILRAPTPRTPCDQEVVWAAERFFIVCHQTSELWLSQALVDLQDAASLADQGDWTGTAVSTARAASVMQLLIHNFEQFSHLPREHFLQFRAALEGMSAMESKQFQEVLLGHRNPQILRISRGLSQALPEIDDAPHDAGECEHQQCATVWSLDNFLKAVMSWRKLHLEIASRLIGSHRGTGGTSGAEFLRRGLLADMDEYDEWHRSLRPGTVQRGF